MPGPILVAYASRYGSTREVAESIGATLRVHGLLVDVQPAGEVEALERYSGVVLGGGIYIGRWHRNARGFVSHFEQELRALPLAIFALGPLDDTPAQRKESEKQFRGILAKLPVEPFATFLFGGAVDPRKLSFPFNHMPAADIRDWDAVRGWADGLAEQFQPARPLARV